MDFSNQFHENKKRIILMSCGRYNPPTKMHLRMFERARDYLESLGKYEVMGGVITLIGDKDGKKELPSSVYRYEMLDLALEGNRWVKFSIPNAEDFECTNVKDVLHYHQKELHSFICNKHAGNETENEKDLEWIPDDLKNNPHSGEIYLKLLCGSDLLQDFTNTEIWPEENIVEILNKYGLVFVSNEVEILNKLLYESDILSHHMQKIIIVSEWIPNIINSGRIRRALKRGESVKYLLQDSVVKFIYDNDMYRSKYSTRAATMDTEEKGEGIEKPPGNRIILMACGSYNPPTDMHLRMFERARDYIHSIGSDVVVGGFISPVNDAYEKKDLVGSMHRCEMLKLALANSDWIRLSSWETRQLCWTRTRPSLQYHQNILNCYLNNENDARNDQDNEDYEWIPESIKNDTDKSPIKLKLLCGGDLLESFAVPNLWADEDIADIVGTYGLVVINREGSNPYKFIYDSDILSKYIHNILIVTEWIPNEVSSTRIRRALKRGESVKYLLQDSVIEYIYKNGIYNAQRPSNTKLELHSNPTNTNYLDTNDANEEIVCLTLSNDVVMETSSIEKNLINKTSNTCENEKNLKNSSNLSHNSDPSSSLDDTELVREKFFRSVLSEPDGSLSSLTVYHSLSKPVITNELEESQIILAAHETIDDRSMSELPSSLIGRKEQLAFEDTDENTLCDNSYSDKEDVLSITNDENSDELIDDSIKNKDSKVICDSEEQKILDVIHSDNTSKTPDVNESLSLENEVEDSDSLSTKFETNIEIDGKVIKSLVNLKKSSKKISDNSDTLIISDTLLSDDVEENEDNIKSLHSEPLQTEVCEEKVKEKLDKAENDQRNFTKLFEDDFSYTKRLRMIINYPEGYKRQIKGSLDSINVNEFNTAFDRNIESLVKKCKSLEMLRRNASLKSRTLSIKTPEILYCDLDDNKAAADSTSQLVTERELDTQTDEFCTACCLDNEAQLPSSTEVFYTLRSSNCSTPVDEDSTECDICSSCNLQDSGDVASGIPPAEEDICEICGELATDSKDISSPKVIETKEKVINTRSLPLSLPKAASNVEIHRGSFKMREEEKFEIDNCGLINCKLRSSLNTCNKPEPIYVNVIPKSNYDPIDRSSFKNRESSRLNSEPLTHSLSLRSKDRCVQDFTYIGPKDEVVMMSRIINKRLNRKGSHGYPKIKVSDQPQEKRRYSSVDNLQNRLSFKLNEKSLQSKENSFMSSADNIRPRSFKGKTFRCSADNVDQFCISTDNLDFLEESADAEEDDAIDVKTPTKDSEKSGYRE